MTSESLTLESPVADIDGRVANRKMGRQKGRPAFEVLATQLGIETVGQLLRHYPRRYIDRSNTVSIRAVRTVKATQPTLAVAGSDADRRRISIGQWVTVIAHVHSTRQRWTRNRQQMVTVTIDDGTAKLDLPFFNQPWLANQFEQGLEVAVSGRVGMYRGNVQLQQQEVEILRGRRGRHGPHRPHHPRAPRDRGHHAAHDPRAGLPRAAAARSRSASRCRPTSWPART